MKEKKDIEWLLHWAFSTQFVEQAAGDLKQLGPSSGPGGFESLALLGVRVDCSSSAEKMLGVCCHDDAAMIYDTVMRIDSPEAKGLLILHARANTRPDWIPAGVGKLVPVLDRNGKPRRMYRNPEKSRGDLGPMMEWQGNSVDMVEYHRAMWSAWHEGMCVLVDAVNADMTSFIATPPKAQAAPWDWTGTIHYEETG